MTTDNNDLTDENATDQSEDNSLIRSLRQELKDKDKELKARPDRAALEAEIRAELEREDAIAEQLVALGHPKGMSGTVGSRLGDQEITRETVIESLRGIGYEIAESDEASSEAKEPSQERNPLAEVTTLSSQVRAVAEGRGEEDVLAKIAKAGSPAELDELMGELGLRGEHL